MPNTSTLYFWQQLRPTVNPSFLLVDSVAGLATAVILVSDMLHGYFGAPEIPRPLAPAIFGFLWSLRNIS